VFSSAINEISDKLKFIQQQKYKVDKDVQTDAFYQSLYEENTRRSQFLSSPIRAQDFYGGGDQDIV